MIRSGTRVNWKWGSGYGHGKVKETFTTSVTRTIKSTEVTRDGSDDDKALLIEQDDGDQVLKLESEVDRDD